MEFEGKTVVVTGGANGIGRGIARAFCDAGAHVVVADIDAKGGNALAGALGCAFVQTDVSREEDCRALAENAAQKHGKIHALINNAGIARARAASVDDPGMEGFDRVLAVNLRGAFMCARFCAARMGKGGAIVNIASTRAHMSESNTEGYAASKGGLRALTHALAVTLGPRGVRVNAISPGWIFASGDPESLRPIDHAQHPAGRVGVPEDIAQACLFLCSDRAGFITGANLNVDGGMSIKMIYEE